MVSGSNDVGKFIFTSEYILSQVDSFWCFADATSCDVKDSVKYIGMSIVKSYPKE